MNKDHSSSSKAGSMMKHSNFSNSTIKNMTCKSISINQVKPLNNSKVIRFARYMKASAKNHPKSRKKDEVSKCEIDLSGMYHTTSSRRKRTHSKKESKSFEEETKSAAAVTVRSPDIRYSSKDNDKGFPMQPGKALKIYMNNGLSEYEQSEILDYKNIYFIGNTAEKIKGSKTLSPNDGYDDNRGDYKTVMNDHIYYRYEIISNIGQGSFGKVFKAYDHREKKHIAIKIIRNKKKFEFQANVEIKVLLDIKKHDTKDKSNIIRIIDNFKFRNHICLTFDLYSINLYELIRSNDHKGFPLDIVRRVAIQILQGLRFLKKRGI